jgi:HAD superfamily hydrolase (TIGR01484 family)
MYPLNTQLKPLNQLPITVAKSIDTVLCDIDDTITTDGRLSASAYSALEQLQSHSIRVIPITGRPAGWCDLIARLWPVHAVVGENGAFYMCYDHHHRNMHHHFWADVPTRARNRQALDILARKIIKEVPGCALASDQPYRVADLAIDFCEDVTPLPEDAVNQIVTLFEDAGAHAKVSSIHVNGWFGDYDKLTMTATMTRQLFGQPLSAMQNHMLFIGDSANDAPMFEFFDHSVGVANVRAQQHRIKKLPKYICENESGEGFAEMVNRLLALKEM